MKKASIEASSTDAFQDRAVCSAVEKAFGLRGLDGGNDAHLADGTHARSAHAQGDPFLLFRDVELAILQVRCEGAARLDVRVGHLVTGDDVLSCDLANLGHGCGLLRGAKIVIWI